MEKPASLYFVGPVVDGLLVGGASILVFAALRCAHYSERTQTVATLAGWLAWVCNWPHFSATSYRLYRSSANIRRFPWTAVVAPLVVTAGALGSFFSSKGVAPYFVKLFSIWSPYHFSGQTFGITLIYAKRSGFSVGKLERRTLWAFIFGTFITESAFAETRHVNQRFFDISYPSLGIPSSVAQACLWSTIIAGLLAAFLIGRWCWRARRFPVILVIPAAAQLCWFVLANGNTAFLVFVPFFHSLQYLIIAWSVQLAERADSHGGMLPKRQAWSESVRWGLLNIAGGAMLFYAFPNLGSILTGVSLGFSTGIILAAVQIHHFFVDGVIWKLRSMAGGRSPLLANVCDLLHAKPAPEHAQVSA